MRLLPSSIRTRLVLWFLAVSLAPLAVVLGLSMRESTESLERARIASIAAIAEAKAARLDALVRERSRLVEGIATGVAFIAAARDLAAATRPDGTRDEAAFGAAADRFRPRAETWLETVGAPDFLLLDLQGNALFSAGAERFGRQNLASSNTSFAKAIELVRSTRKPAITPPAEAEEGDRPMPFVVGPILDRGELIGFAAVDFTAAEIDAIVADYAGLGETGDVTCVAKVGRDLVVVAPTRADPASAYSVRAPVQGATFNKRLQELVLGNSARGRGTDLAGREVFGAWTRVQSLGWGIAVTQSIDEALEAALAQRRHALLAGAVGIVPIALVAWLVARSLTRPVLAAARAGAALARGDFTEPVPVYGRGEPRALLESMRDAVAGLGGILIRVRDSGVALDRTARALRAGALEQGEIAHQFGSSSTEISAAVREITSTQQELNQSVQSVAAAAREAMGAAREGRTALSALSDEIGQLTSGAASVSARLEAMRERAERINLVIASVAKVANQTNLLSVNAAMEAERAGEAGAGFRAVATEIRRLSEQTADAAIAIETIVREMQQAVADGVSDMRRYGETVSAGTSAATRLGATLGTVIGGVERLGEEMDLVARGMEAQAFGVAQVSEAIETLSSGAARSAGTSSGFVSASADLETRAEGFAAEVARFRLPSAG